MTLRWDTRIWEGGGRGLMREPRRRAGALDMPFCIAVVAMFDAGCDTAAIAKRLIEREGVVAQALRIGLEARRAA